MNFIKRIEKLWHQKKIVCVGLDPDYAKIPPFLKKNGSIGKTLFIFNKMLVDATSDIVCAYKPNSAFYEAYGSKGLEALQKTIGYIKKIAPQVPIILDAKRGDIGNTNSGYARFAFDEMGADAVTLHPYLGQESAEPFLSRGDKFVFILVKTSNPGAGEFQDLEVNGEPLYKIVAKNVAIKWNGNGNCGLVVGATYPGELKIIRKIVGDMPILIPGIGAQGGDIKATINAGKNSKGYGMIVNSSRGIIFASKGKDFAEKAREKTIELSNKIEKYLWKQKKLIKKKKN